MTEDGQAIIDWILSIVNNPDADLSSRRSEISEALVRLKDYDLDRASLARKLSKLQGVDDLLIRSRLHDGPLQNLSMATQLFQEDIRLAEDANALRALAMGLVAQLQHEIDSLRALLLQGTDPVPGMPTNLVTELRQAIRARPDGTQISLRIRESPDGEYLEAVDAQMATAVLQFVRETLRNASKHGHATRLAVEVSRCGDRLVVRTLDNGIGFPGKAPTSHEDLQSLADSGRLGLRILHELVVPFDGNIEIQPNGSLLGGAAVELSLRLQMSMPLISSD